MSAPLVVAIDGPAGSGKSTVGRAVACELAFACLDTGAAYRALAWVILDRGIDLDDENALVRVLDHGFALEIGVDPAEALVAVASANGMRTDITAAIREPRVTAVVSAVARVSGVRQRLNALFRDTIETSAQPGIVVEGRDITTVVAPDAPVRVLLTASEEARMTRRSAEIVDQSDAETRARLRARDRADSQVASFMSAHDGVITIDTTDLDRGQTVAAVLDLVTTETARIAHGK